MDVEKLQAGLLGTVLNHERRISSLESARGQAGEGDAAWIHRTDHDEQIAHFRRLRDEAVREKDFAEQNSMHQFGLRLKAEEERDAAVRENAELRRMLGENTR